jgi:hypothetical protein
MNKAPRPSKVRGAIEQGELFDVPVFRPRLPPANSYAAQALHDLLNGTLTQLDWLQRGFGWRLAAAIKELDYLGWCPESMRAKCAGWARPIAHYSLPEFARQAAYAMGANLCWSIAHGRT